MSRLPTGQLGFDDLLRSADADNQSRRVERDTAPLPGAMDEALPLYRLLLRRHHAAMLDANVAQAMRLREQARKLALKLNGGEGGILADDDAPGCVLARKSAAVPDTVPLWGQTGEFMLDVCGMRIRVAFDGIFGIAGSVCYWPGFAVHAVDLDKPFLSQTGYRRFLGIHAEPQAGLVPDHFAAGVIQAHVDRELKGALRTIKPCYAARRGA